MNGCLAIPGLLGIGEAAREPPYPFGEVLIRLRIDGAMFH